MLKNDVTQFFRNISLFIHVYVIFLINHSFDFLWYFAWNKGDANGK